jgi:hypothetical protein
VGAGAVAELQRPGDRSADATSATDLPVRALFAAAVELPLEACRDLAQRLTEHLVLQTQNHRHDLHPPGGADGPARSTSHSSAPSHALTSARSPSRSRAATQSRTTTPACSRNSASQRGIAKAGDGSLASSEIASGTSSVTSSGTPLSGSTSPTNAMTARPSARSASPGTVRRRAAERSQRRQASGPQDFQRRTCPARRRASDTARVSAAQPRLTRQHRPSSPAQGGPRRAKTRPRFAPQRPRNGGERPSGVSGTSKCLSGAVVGTVDGKGPTLAPPVTKLLLSPPDCRLHEPPQESPTGARRRSPARSRHAGFRVCRVPSAMSDHEPLEPTGDEPTRRKATESRCRRPQRAHGWGGARDRAGIRHRHGLRRGCAGARTSRRPRGRVRPCPRSL